MSTGWWIGAALLMATPITLHLLALRRSRYLRLHFAIWLGTLAAGAVLALPLLWLERILQAWAEIGPTQGGEQITRLLYGFLVAAPAEMAIVVAAVAPFWRMHRVRMRAGLSREREVKEGVSFAISSALGFVTVRSVFYLVSHGDGWLSLTRIVLGSAAFVMLCSFWGWMLGRHAARGLGGRRFSTAWLVATLFSAVCDQLIFGHGRVALFAVLPLMACMLVVAWILWRDAKPSDTGSSVRFSILGSGPAPSLGAIREAFRRQDSPVTLRWIGFGALVTTGMITAGLAAAVLLGHELGLDFSVVDRTNPGAEVLAPLVLLGSGTMAAFPAAGYLLARASNTRSVLEPAIATALAMVLLMVFMGMLAPVSVVFAIAFAPIAFALSCAGAWLGLAR